MEAIKTHTHDIEDTRAAFISGLFSKSVQSLFGPTTLIHMATNHHHSATIKLFLRRPHFRHPKHSLNPTTSFPYHHHQHQHPIQITSVHIQTRRLILHPPCVLNITGDVIQDAGASLFAVAGGYALVSGFDNLTQRQIIQQVRTYLISILSSARRCLQ